MSHSEKQSERPKYSMWLWVGLLSLITGFCLVAFLYEATITYFRYHNGLVVLGTVQNVRAESNTDADWTSYDISFKAADGQTHKITNRHNTTDTPPIYQAGQLVRVVYNPQDPDDGRLNSRREKYGVIAGTLLMTASGLSALAFFYFGRRRFSLVAGPARENGKA